MRKSICPLLLALILEAQSTQYQAQQIFTSQWKASSGPELAQARDPAPASAPPASAPPDKQAAKQNNLPENPVDLEKEFRSDKDWSGGDGAYSISLPDNKVLWLFGDSMLGTINNGSAKDALMIHNAVALQDLKAGKMAFYWKHPAKPASFFDDAAAYWLWPGDGTYYGGRVYCFARRVGQIPGKEGDPFGFVWKQDELIVINNPKDKPDNWQCRHAALDFTTSDFHLGSACLQDGAWLYVLGMREKTRQAILARISLVKLAQNPGRSFEFLSTARNGKPSWCKHALQASTLFDRVATEGSLLKTKDGYLCLYHRNSMGADIVARKATQIEGPWSDEQLLYQIPEAQTKRGFCYAGKAHPEQPADPGFLALTYSVNPGTLEAYAKDPLAYFPHVVYLKNSQK
jgi:hypothetical protein